VPRSVTADAHERRIARRVHVRGVVQGVGFRPYVFRLARSHALAGWVLNGDDGVRIHVEGDVASIENFLRDLTAGPPPAARISSVGIDNDAMLELSTFEIRESKSAESPTTRISPDLPLCADCLRELFDAGDRRFRYPYINCTNCGPRFSIVRALPYDRARTTMAGWPLCEQCAEEYRDPQNRRFHAQPTACRVCGPQYLLVRTDGGTRTVDLSCDAITEAARLVGEGRIVAMKGIGGYHLVCDATNGDAVASLRERKCRKEKPFAVMMRDMATARRTAWLTGDTEQLLQSPARPIVLCLAREELSGVAPGTRELGLMLPYAPLHHLLFDAGAPDRIVMTSGNRSNEPLAYRDDDAEQRLGGIVDAILVGERPIGRRVDDSVVRVGITGPVVVRRSRGFAPGLIAQIAARQPILAVGADLKNTVTLVIDGQACMSQHVGDLEHYDAFTAFRETVDDLLAMYDVDGSEVVVAHDLHPEYVSSRFARTLGARRVVAVQHHRAHIASVLAERGEIGTRVVGVAFDGTGYGDDGTIWGGEFFVGSVREGFARVGHLRPATLPGGDAAARFPVQAAAGFVGAIEDLPDLTAPPFCFPSRYVSAASLSARNVRSFGTTSAGRLFDTVAAVAGFTRPISFEGQAAIWLEQLACTSSSSSAYSLTFDGVVLDWRPALREAIENRSRDRDPADIARAFHRGLGRGAATAAIALADTYKADAVVLSGGVFQNDLLLNDVLEILSASPLRVLTNSAVPPNDGGISLGQAAIAASQMALKMHDAR
jgi:hydrogenase maturation protein HypF